MSEQQLELYRKHPEYGAEILEGNSLVNNTVKQIVLQHHERFDGSGFPFGLKGAKVLTLASIVGLADYFAHIIVEKELKPVDALKVLLQDRPVMSTFNSAVVENLIKSFVDPDKIKKDQILPSNSRVIPSKKAS
jgi:HD-GYP domain-containing protein (c-di-GMP phosphodiesterase class II)